MRRTQCLRSSSVVAQRWGWSRGARGSFGTDPYECPTTPWCAVGQAFKAEAKSLSTSSSSPPSSNHSVEFSLYSRASTWAQEKGVEDAEVSLCSTYMQREATIALRGRGHRKLMFSCSTNNQH
eukprot:5543085-Amphidinium_carterae.2